MTKVTASCNKGGVSQLYRAWRASGLTLTELLVAAGLSMSKVSASRKLRGKQTMSDAERVALCRVLRVRASSVPRVARETRRVAA